MLPGQLGGSRTSHKANHLLQAPDSFIRAPLPGMEGATAIVHAGPALGACFTEYTAELEPGGRLGVTSAQRFFFVKSGRLLLNEQPIEPGGFGFVPQGEDATLKAGVASVAVVIEKPYESDGTATPRGFVSNLSSIPLQPLLGDEGVQVQALIPAGPEFDFAVNLLTFSPGASLPMVESHIMEHGLVMLAGGGMYKLGDHWYPTMADDFIWMAPYCPQWFGAIGKTPAKYLIYKDWNRHPL